MIVPVNAAQTVNYAVSAWANNGSTLSTPFSSSFPYVIRSTAGGYMVTIPPNVQSGYLIIAGYMPVVSTSVVPDNWSIATNYNTLYSLKYIFSSSPTLIEDDSIFDNVFNGVVYVPAHNSTLYLIVSSRYSEIPYGYGVRRLSNAFINFIPDSPDNSSEVVGGLTEINQSIQNIINQITSSSEANADSEAMVEHMEQLQERIDELSQQIEDNTSRPPPEDLVPSIPPVMVSPSNPAAIDGRKAISDMLSSSFFTTFLLMVFSLAFLRYVLFGKSK